MYEKCKIGISFGTARILDDKTPMMYSNEIEFARHDIVAEIDTLAAIDNINKKF